MRNQNISVAFLSLGAKRGGGKEEKRDPPPPLFSFLPIPNPLQPLLRRLLYRPQSP